MMMLPTSISEISNLYFKSFFKFWSFVQDEFCVEGWEKFFGSFWFLFLFGLTNLFFQFFHFLFTFLLELFNFSSDVFSLILVQIFILESFFKFFNFHLDLNWKLWLLIILFLRFRLMIGTEVILMTIKAQSVSVKFLVGKLTIFDDFSDFIRCQTQQNILRL